MAAQRDNPAKRNSETRFTAAAASWAVRRCSPIPLVVNEIRGLGRNRAT
ncbi:hypothetical protein BZL29_4418 [Mycobacterium kansasii]|uniref:Uncharacterized protein n=1 Tax=Mycobacterium kansasii TaxID=1768 RepID=A0A1V3X625_MYCKA|nr:hypothetical protein BZL29_4418 [Mycobacterium kansasii]